MPDNLNDRILALLGSRSGLKAAEIATALGVDKTAVNQALYGALKSALRQDSAYRWSILSAPSSQPSQTFAERSEQFADTDLARLCRYYLSCLGYDEAGVSAFLNSKFGDLDYIEANAIPKSASDLADSDAARKLSGRKRTERGRYALYFGYPTSIALIRSRRSDWQGLMVEPILLFPIEQDSATGKLSVDLSFPIINQKPFRSFTNAERDMLMNELVQLEQELGLSSDEDRPEIDEIAMRLQSVRPEWPWRENISPATISNDRTPLSELTVPGIYNRAVLIMAEKSPFTQGLEQELRELANLPPSKFQNTALGRWLRNEAVPDEPTKPAEPLLEVLPMNSEQRQAVASALTRPVTIITGPPGTGKSQVVTNLLANAAWSGKRILFASKNNKAVDVVETRFNGLGSRPILLRVGSQAYQVRLAEYVLALLSAITTASEKGEFLEARTAHSALLAEQRLIDGKAQELVEMRNEVDRLERESEDARQKLGPDLFANTIGIDIKAAKLAVSGLEISANLADRSRAAFFIKLIWPLLRRTRLSDLAQSINVAKEELSRCGVDLPIPPDDDEGVASVLSSVNEAKLNISLIEKAVTYFRALRVLQNYPSLEEIAHNEAALLERIARNSERLWELWLRIHPSTISAAERQKLGKYTSLLRMVIEAGDRGKLSTQAYRQYSSLMKEISHLLPCWAVTSLSARGRIPFEPGAFDIVVFDEASQCDIASALPLLYRAKSIVVIGDPKQLSHISSLKRGQDQNLLEKFDLLEEFPHWSYSHQSLFGLGATMVSGDDIVTLVDHHRSHADIINFSNQEFYESRLRVATKYDSLKRPNTKEPGIRWIDVKGKATRPGNGGAVNHVETLAIVETLRDLVIDKEYGGSIGVVTPFRAQANAITAAVNQDEKLSEALIRSNFLADTVHRFQGDERDVMLFSPVVADGLPIGALAFLRENGNLFNVAITRARAQLTVVGDLAACASSDVGYLSRFATYSASLKFDEGARLDELIVDAGSAYPKVARPEVVSDWERNFYVAAYKAGFRLVPQYAIEKYLVDFLMVTGERKLVIEIDGERYHRNWTGELCRRDQIRNQRLIELGYDVMRFWVYEVRDDLDGCFRQIRNWQEKCRIN